MILVNDANYIPLLSKCKVLLPTFRTLQSFPYCKLNVFDHFVGLAHKGLTSSNWEKADVLKNLIF